MHLHLEYIFKNKIIKRSIFNYFRILKIRRWRRLSIERRRRFRRFVVVGKSGRRIDTFRRK